MQSCSFDATLLLVTCSFLKRPLHSEATGVCDSEGINSFAVFVFSIKIPVSSSITWSWVIKWWLALLLRSCPAEWRCGVRAQAGPAIPDPRVEGTWCLWMRPHADREAWCLHCPIKFWRLMNLAVKEMAGSWVCHVLPCELIVLRTKGVSLLIPEFLALFGCQPPFAKEPGREAEAAQGFRAFSFPWNRGRMFLCPNYVFKYF